MKTRLALVLSSFAVAVISHAAVKLPAIFSDHAVLQREQKVPVWGWADAGEEVTVSIAGQKHSAKAGADGKWCLQFENLKAKGPQELVVKGTNEITIKDVLVGEVWLGSGQSNMAMKVSAANDYDAEKAAANTPEIRVFTEGSTAMPQASSECKGTWVVCSPETVGTFSATAYFFGREIYRELKVPVGLINSSVGGTPIESWISPEAQAKSPELKDFAATVSKAEAAINMDALKAKYEKDLAEWKEKANAAKAAKMPVPRPPRDPSATRDRKGNIGGLFNGKIAPLVGYAIRGAIWYQGEANSNGPKPPFYQHQLPLLVTDWRTRWGYEFPFAWVQLPNFGKGTASDGWCLVREAMLKTLKLPKTGMAITIDVGEPKNIHPKNKQAVGKRLAAWALGTVYGGSGETSGPIPAGHEIKGGEVVVKFTHAKGLKSKDGAVTGFTIAGEDKQWHDAQAKIDGEKVTVSSADVPHPVAVRYAWKDVPVCNLYNGADLPASPFRTDDWEIKLDAARPVAKKAAKVTPKK